MTRRSRHAAERATDREVGVVAAVLASGSEKAAAHRLGLSHSTVKHHLANARSKVGAETTAQLVWIRGPRLPEPGGPAAHEQGLVPSDLSAHTAVVGVIRISEATQMSFAAPRSATYAGLAADDLGHSDDRPPLVLLHGLTFDRQMWRPTLAELETIDPGRRAIALDLPGHGDSPDGPSYMLEALVERVHAAVEDAGLEAPVVVGHSAAGGTAFLYGVMHPCRGVVAVENTLRVGSFAAMAQSLEPALRGPGFNEVFAGILAHAFQLDQVTPDVRAFVEATSKPRQAIVLGYWQALFEFSPDELDAMVAQGASAIRASGLPFASVFGGDPSPDDLAWIGANIPDMRIEVWPHSGHFPHVAHPRRFAELLAETGTWRSRSVGRAHQGRSESF